jgi:hypothetical protein
MTAGPRTFRKAGFTFTVEESKKSALTDVSIYMKKGQSLRVRRR